MWQGGAEDGWLWRNGQWWYLQRDCACGWEEVPMGPGWWGQPGAGQMVIRAPLSASAAWRAGGRPGCRAGSGRLPGILGSCLVLLPSAGCFFLFYLDRSL